MKKFVEENKLQDRVIVPEDGEILKFWIFGNLKLNNDIIKKANIALFYLFNGILV